MKKQMYKFIIVVILLSFGAQTYAQYNSISFRHGDDDKPTGEIRDRIEEKRDSILLNRASKTDSALIRKSSQASSTEERRVEINEEREIRKEERLERLSERAKERIAAYAERIFKRLYTALERMDKIADRIKSRMEKMEEKGFETGETAALLAKAREQIEAGRNAIDEAAKLVETALENDNPKDSFKEIRVLIKEAVQSVKDAHKSLIEAIKELRAIPTPSRTSSENPEEDEEESNDSEEN